MSISNCDMERIAHLHVEDRDFNLYICICYNTMTLHAYKYDDQNINYDWFNDMPDFMTWVQQPIIRIK